MIGVAGPAAALPIAAAMAGVSYGLASLEWRFRSRWWERHLQTKVEQLSSTFRTSRSRRARRRQRGVDEAAAEGR